MLSLFLASLLPLLGSAQSDVVTINVMSKCPNTINIFLDRNWIQEIITPNGPPQVITIDGDNSVQLSTSANNGTTVGFNFFAGEFFIFKNTSFFDVGVTVIPDPAGRDFGDPGFCGNVTCDSANCTTASTTFLTIPNLAPNTPPAPPLFACPPAPIWNVIFCPDGSQPSPASIPRAIHPLGIPGKCLDVQGNVQADGTPVQVFDCNGSAAQQWLIGPGNTQVRLAGTNFCLDAGSNPASGIPMKIWQCFDGLPQQSWFYTDDERIAVTNQGLCLDVPNGNLANGQVLQTFTCTDLDQNQVFTD
ncbi:carbohydrate-binding module family 13 protein [Sphaerobolus stellatus SS14]|uniref:Carbohydrate-binding module family 13 protein n=1 Tax=Sphaerobolus stellatus (strain SS14) TaxID=990650 RepID=A0A0C9TW13_SPHS4|nr:carbohydrate-binding module family 13 protein [Sphaerobolus stellatus SS14]